MSDKKTIKLEAGQTVDLVELIGFDPFIDPNFTTDSVEIYSEEDLDS